MEIITISKIVDAIEDYSKLSLISKVCKFLTKRGIDNSVIAKIREEKVRFFVMLRSANNI